MGPRVVDDQEVPRLQGGQRPVHGEFVAVLAQGAGDVHRLGAGDVLLPGGGDVMVGPVDGGTHQVGGAGVHSHVLLVDVLEVQHPGHQTAVGTGHKAPQLAAQAHIPHAGGDQDLLKFLLHAPADQGDVVGLLLRAVGDADAAGEVDIPDMAPGLLLQLRRQAEEDARQLRVVLVGDGVGGQKGVDAEGPRPLGPQGPEGLGDLGPGHAVFGVAGGVHHLEPVLALPQSEHAAGVIAAEDGLRNVPDGLLQKRHMGQVVQIDDGPQRVRQPVLLRQGVVGGEHDLMAPEAALLRQQQLHQAGAVRAAALLPEELEDGGVGGGLDGKVLLEAGVPGEGGVDPPGVLPQAFFVVEVEGGGVFLYDLVQL